MQIPRQNIMQQNSPFQEDVVIARPDPDQIWSLGLLAADTHFHTNHSDSNTCVRDALKLAD
jgi:hypothetical protein